MTNGEKIKKIFPNVEISPNPYSPSVDICVGGILMMRIDRNWWNAEYIEPTTKNDLGVDAISRAEVLKIFDEWFATCDIADKKASPKAKIKALPSVTPIRPKGYWISRWHAGHDLHFHVCSECNEEFSCDMETGISIDNYRYCPNCGADMREVEE